ncbi:ABC transporter ATP-binding protein [Chromatocurvus halotolerans]|uniref:Putative ABC transport system ATP-binding protein n=1 Tax=Chromatocurvus halotolerans TaxID=1132028 RepID=A0A4R2L3X1_9GAMM|nr:ABC transporter ATP-binding protein [Chromatocurvus halotolerans]TCO78516.1 putative ABC transport system ATP-binding protein [Chromatocurvus halotolerans]
MSESEQQEAALPLNKRRRAFGAVESHYPLRDLAGWFRTLLGAERRYFWLAVIYGVAISGLTLAVPLAVQMLIDSIANTALVRPLVVLSVLLFGMLATSGVLSALRTYLMELYGRRVHARLMADFSLRAVYAQATFFENRKRDVLFDRYFDIMTLQRNVPELLIGAFAIFLQSIMGFIVVSFYHPVFLGFNLVLIVLIYLVWRIWGPAAIRTGIDLSDAKYEAAAWLDHLGSANSLYKSRTHIQYALSRSETLTARYIDQEKRHFRQTFAQTIALLFLYALASSLLLGLGGWLVIQGELSLGQLVAAELIMSAIFVGMAQFDSYLRRFYYVCMAVAEISELHEIPLESTDGESLSADGSFDLRFRDVHRTTRSREAHFHFTIPEGETVRVDAEEEVLQRMITSMLERNEAPEHGYITIGEVDIAACDIHGLRQYLMVERRPMIMDGSIADYLVLSGADRASRGEMFEMLRLVGIDEVVRELDQGLDTILSPIGLPLSAEEVLRLKLATALLACPRILVVGEVFGLVDRSVWERVLAYVAERPEMTFMLFSRDGTLPHVDRVLRLGWHDQVLEPPLESADSGTDDAGGADT